MSSGVKRVVAGCIPRLAKEVTHSVGGSLEAANGRSLQENAAGVRLQPA